MMRVVTGQAQEQYWKRVRYRGNEDPVTRAYATPKIEHISKFIDLHRATILDVGCGTGVFTSLLCALSPFVVGLDYSEYMLRRNPGRVLLRGRGEELPFKAATFDVVFVANLLHHSEDPAAIVREIARVSKHSIVLIEPNRLNPLIFLFSLLVREERGGLRSSKSYLTRLLRDSGLEVLHCCAMGMISQNNTPKILVPLLRIFDGEMVLGEYVVAVARKP